MITKVRNVVSENPIAEVWKFLRFFLHTAKTISILRRIHNVPVNRHESNLRKQAEQIGYCIRQAEQYFMASQRVDLTTRPVLLYYGAINLSQALILLKKDGTFSLDARRAHIKHNHHGLDLDRGLAERTRNANSCEEFFQRLECSVHKKENEAVFWGHFPLFYGVLSPGAFVLASDIRDVGKTTYIVVEEAHVCANPRPLESYAAEPFNVLELMKTLPDLYFALGELGIRAELCRGNVNRMCALHYRTVNDEGNPIPPVREKTVESCDFFIDGIACDRKNALLGFYKQQNNKIEVEADFPNNLILKMVTELKVGEPAQTRYFPDIVDDVSGRKFYILRSNSYVPEAAAILIILFCLGMLSRYYPDLWVKLLDKDVEVSELTNSFLNVVSRKFPNLVLDEMTEVKHYIHL